MKVIDLLNKIANGEVNENTLVEFDNGYKDYCTVRTFFNRYIMDRENLNCEVEIIEEDKKIPEKIPEKIIIGKKQPTHRIKKIEKKINEIIDYLEEKE